MPSARLLKAWIRLSLHRSVGRNWNRWLAELAAENLAFEDFLELPEHRARRHLQNWPEITRALRQAAPSATQIDDILAHLERRRVRLLPITDPRYPGRLLADLGFDAPTFLYLKGSLNHLRGPTIALIGTRQPSPAGIETARAYAAALAREGVHIISGHARGIDTAAHLGALEAGGATTMVLPHGIFLFDAAVPLRELATADNALVLSQFAPDAPSGPYPPVKRNATVASLADGLIVIESGLVSGTSYAFKKARELHKPLWTVIYPEPVPKSAAGNRSLLAAGARPLKPGAEGATQAAPEIVRRLKEYRSAHPREAAWPPVESPGQLDLFNCGLRISDFG